MYKDILVIAEVKTKSLFGYNSLKSWDELFELANQTGDWISIHTDERWEGSFDLIKKARKLTSKPILAKGIHRNNSDIIKAVESGADYVLVVGRIPNVHQDKSIIEPLDLNELSNIPSSFKVIWNARNLETGSPKKETFEQAREIWKGWLCQASYVKNAKDIKKEADAVLVGESLFDFANSL